MGISSFEVLGAHAWSHARGKAKLRGFAGPAGEDAGLVEGWMNNSFLQFTGLLPFSVLNYRVTTSFEKLALFISFFGPIMLPSALCLGP